MTSFNFLSVLESVKILKLESEQMTKTLDLLIVHLVENQDKKIDDLETKKKKEKLEQNLKKLVEDF